MHTKLTHHVMHESACLGNKMNNDMADGHFHIVLPGFNDLGCAVTVNLRISAQGAYFKCSRRQGALI